MVDAKWRWVFDTRRRRRLIHGRYYVKYHTGSIPVLTTKNITMIDLDKAKFIGEGEWVKDSAYQVYELDGKYYSVIVIGHTNKEIMDDSITEIAKEDISKYI